MCFVLRLFFRFNILFLSEYPIPTFPVIGQKVRKNYSRSSDTELGVRMCIGFGGTEEETKIVT